jgi:hypothetical protein
MSFRTDQRSVRACPERSRGEPALCPFIPSTEDGSVREPSSQSRDPYPQITRQSRSRPQNQKRVPHFSDDQVDEIVSGEPEANVEI